MKTLPPTLPDDQLTALLREGEERAFDEIYTRYWDKLYYTAHRMVKSAAVAEEITQDTFMLLWIKRETLEIQSLGPYLAAMLRYEVYRYLAKTKTGRRNRTIDPVRGCAVGVDRPGDRKPPPARNHHQPHQPPARKMPARVPVQQITRSLPARRLRRTEYLPQNRRGTPDQGIKNRPAQA